MNDFKCPCDDKDCGYNPINHDKGCDLCVASSVIDKELPKCFFQSAGGDINSIDDWSYSNFAKIVLNK